MILSIFESNKSQSPSTTFELKKLFQTQPTIVLEQQKPKGNRSDKVPHGEQITLKLPFLQ